MTIKIFTLAFLLEVTGMIWTYFSLSWIPCFGSSQHGTWIYLVVFQSLSRVWFFGLHGPHGLQHAKLPCPSLSPGDCSNSRPFSRWCHPTISFSVTPFSSCPQSFAASVSFPISLLFALGGHCIGASASASVLPINIQGWFPLGLSGWISLLSKGFSRVFSNTTVWKHEFFGAHRSEKCSQW